MFRRVEKYTGVKFFCIHNDEPCYVNEGTTPSLFYKDKVVPLFDNYVNGFFKFGERFYMYDGSSPVNFKVFDSDLHLVEEGNSKGFGFSSQFYLKYDYLKDSKFVHGIMNQNGELIDLEIIDFGRTVAIPNEDWYIYKKWSSNELCAFNIKSGKTEWSLTFDQFGMFMDFNGELIKYKLEKYIGRWKNELLIACYDDLIISLDIQSGKPLRSWHELKGFDFDSILSSKKDKIPHAGGFVLDQSETMLYHLANKFFVWIDLETGTVHFRDISESLKPHFIEYFRWSSGYAEDETHIFTIGLMDQKHFKKKYIPQCLLALNKKTLEIDWVYRFEDDGFNYDPPVLVNNRLYQISASKTLHVFERVS